MFAIVVASQLAFWIGLSLAAQRYPSEYDWRFMTISSLLYPDRDPGGHALAQCGVVLSGLAGLAWALMLAGRHPRDADASASSAPWILAIGYALMAFAAAVPLGIAHIRKSHEILSVAAFLAICAGLAQSRFLAAIAVTPVVLAAVSQAYVHWALPQLPWVSLLWRTRGIPAYLSFAFWQGIACAVFTLLALGIASRRTLYFR